MQVEPIPVGAFFMKDRGRQMDNHHNVRSQYWVQSIPQIVGRYLSRRSGSHLMRPIMRSDISQMARMTLRRKISVLASGSD